MIYCGLFACCFIYGYVFHVTSEKTLLRKDFTGIQRGILIWVIVIIIPTDLDITLILSLCSIFAKSEIKNQIFS